MPDLPTRRTREDELAAAVAAVLSPLRTREPSQVAWGQVRADIARAVHPILAAVYLEAAGQMGATDNMETLASEWATERGTQLAADVVRTTIERLVNQETAADVAAVWLILLDDARFALIAATEVTRTITAGEFAAVTLLVAAGGEKLNPVWFTELDGRVCEICRPLHGTAEEVWKRTAPAGPPAHARCRCWLTYRKAA